MKPIISLNREKLGWVSFMKKGCELLGRESRVTTRQLIKELKEAGHKVRFIRK